MMDCRPARRSVALLETLEERRLFAALVSEVNLVVWASETYQNKPVTFTAAVGTQQRTASIPSGTVTFSEDVDGDGEAETPLGSVELTNGIAQFTTTTLAPGFHWVTASYSGDAAFSADASEVASHHVIYPKVIDVLAIYTARADREAHEADPDGQYSAEDWIYAAIAELNEAFINSRIEASAELVYATQTNYIASGDMYLDLDRLVDPYDGYMDDVPALRNKYGADVVVLWQGTEQARLGGLSYMMQSLKDPYNSSFAFMTVRQDNSTAPAYSFSHEMGHLLGANHDRDTAASEGDFGGGLFADSYGYRFTIGGEPYHDLMAYDDPHLPDDVVQTTIPYFSNPDVMYEGARTGMPGEANAAYAIRSALPVLTKYRPTKVPPSTPTTLTLTTSAKQVQAGAPLTLMAKITKKGVSQQAPRGTVTFYDGATILGTAEVISSKAWWTGTLPEAGTSRLRAVYNADDFYGGSVSATKSVGVYRFAVEDGTLLIDGTGGNDRVSLSLSRGNLVAQIGGRTFFFAATGVLGVTMRLGDGNDSVRLGAGVPAAMLYGDAGNDTLYGSAFDDLLDGGDGNDRLYGRAGNDRIDGGTGTNSLSGEDADDLLIAFNGFADTLAGGAGSDTAWFDSVLDKQKDLIETLHADEPFVG